MTAIAQDAHGDGTPTTADLRRQPARLDEAFNRLRADVLSGIVPSAAVGIGDAKGAIRTDTFVARGRPADEDSLYFLASVTKPIFATAFMQLVEDGLVELDEPIARWLPAFSGPSKERVSARHLLTHTSGVTDVSVEVIARQRPSAARITQMTLEGPLAFEPGTRYEYCSASFYILAELIRVRTGIEYRAFLRERLFEPLGMQSVFDPRRAGRPIVAVHGVGVDNRLVRFLMLRYLAGAALPGGGLFGTLDDLLHFGAAILEPKRAGGRETPLAASTIKLMGEDQLRGLPGSYDGEERGVHFGLGWGKPNLMRPLPGSERVISHGGATGAQLWIDPEAGLVFAYLTNQWSADRSPELEALRRTYEAIAAV